MKFYSIKLFVLLLVNLFVFAVSFIFMQILGSLDNSVAYLINSLISGIIFWGYIFMATKKMKNKDNLSNIMFALKETSVYAILMLIITFISFFDNAVMFNVFLFFLPNTFFFYLTAIPVLGFVLHIVWYAIIVFIARSNIIHKPK